MNTNILSEILTNYLSRFSFFSHNTQNATIVVGTLVIILIISTTFENNNFHRYNVWKRFGERKNISSTKTKNVTPKKYKNVSYKPRCPNVLKKLFLSSLSLEIKTPFYCTLLRNTAHFEHICGSYYYTEGSNIKAKTKIIFFFF